MTAKVKPVAQSKPYHHGNLRDALILAAAELIKEQASVEFAMVDAARRAGVSSAAPYRHFKDRDALLEVSLPYQLFACRLSALLFSLKPHLAGLSADKVIPFVTQHVRDWLPSEAEPAPDQIRVQTRPTEQDPNRMELAAAW